MVMPEPTADELQRYHPIVHGDRGVPDDIGMWCKAEDVAALESELAEAKIALGSATQSINEHANTLREAVGIQEGDSLLQAIKNLRAEVSRLREMIDTCDLCKDRVPFPQKAAEEGSDD